MPNSVAARQLLLIRSVTPNPNRNRNRDWKRPGFIHRGVVAAGLLLLVAGLITGFDVTRVFNPSGAMVSPSSAALFDFCGEETTQESLTKTGAVFIYPGSGLLTASADTAKWTPTGKVGGYGNTQRSLTDITSGKPFGDTDIVPTAQEWYGTAPFTWTRWNSETLNSTCSVGSVTGAFTANIIFGVVVTFTSLGVSLISTVLSIDATSFFAGTVGTIIDQLTDSLFLTYLSPIVLLGTVWIAWNGLVKRRTSVATQGVVWMVMAGVLSLAFLTNGSRAVSVYTDFVQRLTVNLISLPLSEPSSPQTEKDPSAALCYATGPEADLRAATCSLWEVFLFTPWASGQFGSDASVTVEGEPQPWVFGHGKTRTLSYLWMDGFTINHDQVVNGTIHTQGEEVAEATGEENGDAAGSRDETIGLVWAGVTDPDNADAGRMVGAASGAGTEQMMTAVLAFVAASVAAVPIVVLAVTLLGYQIATVFILVLAPVFLTVGIHPGFGRRVALTWVEMLLSNFLKRVLTGLMLGLLLVLLQTATQLNASWLLQVVFIAAVGIGMLFARQRLFTQITTVNIGGADSGMTETRMWNAAKSAGVAGASYVMVGAKRAGATGGREGSTSELPSNAAEPAGGVRNAGVMRSVPAAAAGDTNVPDPANTPSRDRDAEEIPSGSDRSQQPGSGWLAAEREQKLAEQKRLDVLSGDYLFQLRDGSPVRAETAKRNLLREAETVLRRRGSLPQVAPIVTGADSGVNPQFEGKVTDKETKLVNGVLSERFGVRLADRQPETSRSRPTGTHTPPGRVSQSSESGKVNRPSRPQVVKPLPEGQERSGGGSSADAHPPGRVDSDSQPKKP